MTLPAVFVQRPHSGDAVRMDVQGYFIARDFFMRELPDQMTCDWAPKLPSLPTR